MAVFIEIVRFVLHVRWSRKQHLFSWQKSCERDLNPDLKKGNLEKKYLNGVHHTRPAPPQLLAPLRLPAKSGIMPAFQLATLYIWHYTPMQ